ncbi:MAG: GNAT family N-acetyltransferase [Planctomycetes bacterium]|nr:GNAT family N-acetyltransferase [Planctomycetota bacterium]
MEQKGARVRPNMKIWDFITGCLRKQRADESRSEEDQKLRVRKYQRADRQAVLHIAESTFEGVCLDQNIEKAFGEVGQAWQEHKKDGVDYDLSKNAENAFVAVKGNEVVGFVCNRLYHSRSLGHVANLAVKEESQGEGIGKALMKASLSHFRQMGMQYVRIETLVQNEKGQHFYPGLGFKEIGRQIFYFKKLD